MKDKLFFIFFIFIFNSLLFSAPLPFSGDVNNISVARSTATPRWLESAQTHSGRKVFTLNAPEDNKLFNYYMERFSSPEQLRWLNVVMERADIYIDFIDDLLHQNNMPHEILFLPVIESAFRQNAVSRSGAAGMWQFMKNSIAPHNMRVDEFTDERRDFWKATKGAIAKLKHNYEALGGDWYLALAAYNCGLNRVRRTISATGISDYWELSEKGLLPKETIHYVPRLLAMSRILSHKGRNGIATQWRPPNRWERVKLPHSISISRLSEATSIPLDVLRRGNAELNFDITPSGRDYFLKVPEGYGAIVLRALESSDNLMRFYFYQVRRGDTLYDISRHYGVPVRMIENYNRGINPSVLRVGQRLVIPALRDVLPYTGRRTAPVEIPRPRLDDPGRYRRSYVVQPGDTLWSIARKHGSDPDSIAYHNGLQVDGILSIGMRLKVPEMDS
ncbi:MAG: LysM peptidoglycan-binding domain-containing protein [Spirochaetaceae bacterium]|nr:LysM peptidoglycan-binding domain-containing protein [Spirochaetaceae bacterium]